MAIFASLSWFQAKGAYYGKTFGVDGQHNFEEYAKSWDKVFEDMADQAYGRKPLDEIEEDIAGETFKDEELFIDVLLASMGEEPVERTVNLPNTGQVSNLPLGAVLEGTTLVNGSGFIPLTMASCLQGLRQFFQEYLVLRH